MRFEKAYVLERNLKRHREEDELTVTSLPPKKRGRPFLMILLGVHFETIRERDYPVSTEIIRAAARGLVQAMDITS